jgi:hypothetical protein
MDIDKLKQLTQKIKDGTASPEEKELFYNEVTPAIKELNGILEGMLSDTRAAKAD